MARAKDTIYKTVEEANAARDVENAAVKEVGKGKDRRVYKIVVLGEDGNDVERGYVVHTLAGKARSVGALAIGLRAVDTEKPERRPQKSLIEQLAAMKPDELQKIRELLAAMEAPVPKPVPALESVVEPKPKHKGK